MAQQYDTIGKDILNERINEIAQFVLNVPDVEVIADLDTEQQVVRAFRTDITKRIRFKTHEAVLHIELQLRDSSEKPMWARNAHYHGYLVGEHQIPVYSNVIYFHPDAGKNDPGYYAYSWNGYDYRLSYKVIRLIEIEGQAILEAQVPGLLPFTPLMKPPNDITPERWVQQCIDATVATPIELPTKGNLLYGLSLFGGLVHDESLFERIPEALMQESRFFQHQREKFIAQGAKEATLKNILTVLNAKFHVEAVRAIDPALQDIDDLQRLEQLLLTAVNAENLETFTEILFE
ncbi:MAG: YbaB/EbfC family nucleoid-associated protein [Candidatus Poribacteria bacterium]|nr:YbaB/EbfC family nucleoid-associated protein [Candidatus Poribacteria bacterium]